MFEIRHEAARDLGAVEELLDSCFGAGRQAKTSYRFRDGVPPLAELCFVAEDEDGELVGAVRYWPVMAGRQPALLLGPLAISPARQARGIGRALVFHSLETAGAAGHRLVFLVGDPAYYARFGFAVAPAGIVMPGESPARLNYRLLDNSVTLPRSAKLRSLRAIRRSALDRTEAGRSAMPPAKAIATTSPIH
jgi:predicted N-acetyltransferase YhbS